MTIENAQSGGERDRELIAAIRAGGGAGPATRPAWAELLARHHNRLMSVCYRVLGDRAAAADMVQDVCVKILQSLDTFDERSQFATWITRIAINRCYSHLRSEKIRRHEGLEGSIWASRTQDTANQGLEYETPAGLAQARELSPVRGVESLDTRSAVSRALSSLAPEQRAILVLRDVQGMEYEQIAAVLEVELGTVKSRLFRARAALREAVERMGAAETR